MAVDGTEVAAEPQDPAPAEGSPEPAPAPVSTQLSAEEVRNSPEYQAMVSENRKLARRAGTAERAAAQARAEAERARAAAEAQQQQVEDSELEAILGPEGRAFWDRFAELTETDPRAAAIALAEYKGQAQSPTPTPAVPAPQPAGAGQEEPVVPTPQPAAPPPDFAVDASVPVGPANQADQQQQVQESLRDRFAKVAERVKRRERVPTREREGAAIGFLAEKYLSGDTMNARDRQAARAAMLGEVEIEP